MVFGRLKSLFSQTPAITELPFDAPLAPDHAIYVFGDIHGCLDLLRDKIALAQTHAASQTAPVRFVFIGDYVDRGPDSAGVLRLLFDRAAKDADGSVFLLGNHERMMLDFIDDPAGKGRRWLRYGGLDTLASFGISGASEKSDLEDLVEASMELEQALGAAMIAWLRELPMIWSSGNVHCTHAALDPHAAIADQKSSVMLWGHPDFFAVAREDGQWVVHGHTIVDHPTSHSGRIATDTGAYASKRLTVAAITPTGVDFI